MMVGNLMIPIIFFAIGFYAFFNAKKISEKSSTPSGKEGRYKKWNREFLTSLFGEVGGKYYLKISGVIFMLLGVMSAIILTYPQVLKSILNSK
jgi:hypothetical protein